MQPQLLTIIVIIVILYVIQHTSNRIVKENMSKTISMVKILGPITQADILGPITQDELDEVNKLCQDGKDIYLFDRNYIKLDHKIALEGAQRFCF